MKPLFTLLALLGTHTLAQAQTSAKLPLTDNRLPQDNHWTYFTGRYDVSLSDKNTPPMVLSIRMKRDSIVWFSLSANVGVQIPVAKGIIHKDTIKIAINEIPNLNPEKVYFEIPMSDALKISPIPLGIKQVQNLFVGQPLVDTCSQNFHPESRYTAEIINNMLCYSALFQGLLIKSNFDNPNADTKAENPAFTRLRLTEMSNPTVSDGKVSLEHNQWLIVSKESNGDFTALPMALKINTTSAQQSAQVDLTLTTARYDTIPSYPFKIDSSYKKQTLPK